MTQRVEREEIADMVVEHLTNPDLSKRFCPCYVDCDQSISTASGQTKNQRLCSTGKKRKYTIYIK